MPSLEELKDTIEQKAADAPEQFFAVTTIKDEGFERYQCENCDRYFWSTTDRDVCGEPGCDEGYTFINDPPTEKTFSFETAWTEYSSFMSDRGYKPINRYPLAARWRDDTEFVRASIYDFQPFVVSGEVDPPANPLVVPQFCARFNDIDNVGITGRHYTGFIMTGQHAFTDPDAYDQKKYFKDMLDWIVEGMEIPKDEIILHEDSWGGGGNLGACMEFFVDGLELFNQVYMFYEIDDSEQGYSELDTKVLDMGMGHERIVWITHGSETSYEANMPEVIDRLYERTGVEPDKTIWRDFLPYSGLLNMDEVDDIDATWQHIADEIDVDVDRLKDEIEPAAALYSIADHTRTLLIALADGMLPSNSGERHTLRVLARRCLDFIEQYDWDLDLSEIVAWHATSMNGVYPELEDHLEDVQAILEHEQKKYDQMLEKAQQRITDLDEEDIDVETLIELYDSHGISPEMLERSGFSIEKPDDFYTRVAERHDDEQDEDETDDTIPVPEGLDQTRMLFREDETRTDFEAAVLAMFTHDGTDYVVLDQTCFYPTSGGQQHDTGTLGESQVIDVIKQDGVILHAVDTCTMDMGETVSGSIDWERREQLMHHHTATHLVNGAAKQVLGNHVWQAGAKKTEEKGRLDISHFDTLTDEQVQAIEDRVNELIEDDHAVTKDVMTKAEAEQEHGFRIYQGGVPPGNELRIVTIGDGVDIEACGGTHVSQTSEVQEVIITRTTKIQDGVIRLEYKAGDAADAYRSMRASLKDEIGTWISLEDHTLDEVADIFDVDVIDLPGVVERFIDEWEQQRDEIWELEDKTGLKIDHDYDERPDDPEELFTQWKRQKKQIDDLEDELEQHIIDDLMERDETLVETTIATDDVGLLIRIVNHVTGADPEKAVVIRGDNALIGRVGDESDEAVVPVIEDQAEVIQEDGPLVKGFKLKD